MRGQPKILAVDDDLGFLNAVQSALGTEYVIETASDGTSAMRALCRSLPDLVLLDFCLPQVSGLELLRIFKRRFPDTAVVMLTAESKPHTIVETMRAGADDFVIKGSDDFDENLKFRIQQTLERSELRQRNRLLHAENRSRTEENQKLISKLNAREKNYEILGVSSDTLALKRDILHLKGVSSSVLITGENGTGKELVARTLNHQEDDPGRPFIDINCGAIPATLFESEFFGHVKGSFTGATDHRDGKFKLAHGGDIFLDEIGEIPADMQVKLLRVLEERTLTPVGGTKPIHVNVRVIAATNRDLEDEVDKGRFRQDLFYRLNLMRIHVKPLRERRDDILFLSDAFLRRFAPVGRLSQSAKDVLSRYSWPGNTRELHNVIERAAVMAKGSGDRVVGLDHLPPFKAGGSVSGLKIPAKLFPNALDEVSVSRLEQCKQWMERQYVKRSLDLSDGDNEVLFRKLGISRAAYFRLKKRLSLKGGVQDEKGATL